MNLRVIAVLLLIPLLDVMVLVVLATPRFLGPAMTVAIVVLTALIGMLLVRAEGRHTLRRMQQKLARGEPPTDELLDGALLLVSGALMLTPGIVTDFVGLLLVVPPTRLPIRVGIKRYIVTPYIDAKTGGFATGDVYIGGFPEPDPDAPVDVDEEYYRFTDIDAESPDESSRSTDGDSDDDDTHR